MDALKFGGGLPPFGLFAFASLVCLLVSSAQVSAQVSRIVPETMRIDDQPGYVPDPREEQLPAAYQRQIVFYRTTEAPGTIIVHTAERFLYVVQENSRAIRYGIGVGRDGFQWSGLLKITALHGKKWVRARASCRLKPRISRIFEVFRGLETCHVFGHGKAA